MKTKTTFTGILFLMAFIFAVPSFTMAQDKPKGPPSWAPAHGYRAKTRHIYFPQYNVYYDTHKGVYIYLSGDKWQISVEIPSALKGVDLKAAMQVELEMNTDTPQTANAEHREKYKPKSEKEKEDNGKGKSGKGKR